MSSLFRDLDELPPESRYAPVREPHVQAAVDMTRKMVYGLGEREPDLVIAPPKAISKIDHIAELTRSLVYGDMIELAADIWAKAEGEITAESLPNILHRWATK